MSTAEECDCLQELGSARPACHLHAGQKWYEAHAVEVAVVVRPGAIQVAVAVVVVAVATRGSAATSLQEAMLLLLWVCSVSTRAALTTQIEMQALDVQHWRLAPSRVTWM